MSQSSFKDIIIPSSGGGVFMMMIFCLLLSPIFSYIRIKSRSVVAAAIMHGTLNATRGFRSLIVEFRDRVKTRRELTKTRIIIYSLKI